MVYSLTLTDETYAQLSTHLPELAKRCQVVRDPDLASEKQCWYIAGLMSADHVKTGKNDSKRAIYNRLVADETFSKAQAGMMIDDLLGKPTKPVLITDGSDIPF
jgi:hypothetical protein